MELACYTYGKTVDDLTTSDFNIGGKYMVGLLDAYERVNDIPRGRGRGLAGLEAMKGDSQIRPEPDRKLIAQIQWDKIIAPGGNMDFKYFLPETEERIMEEVCYSAGKRVGDLSTSDFEQPIAGLGGKDFTSFTRRKDLGVPAPERLEDLKGRYGASIDARLDLDRIHLRQMERIRGEGENFFWRWAVPQTVRACVTELCYVVGKDVERLMETDFDERVPTLGNRMLMVSFLKDYRERGGYDTVPNAIAALKDDPQYNLRGLQLDRQRLLERQKEKYRSQGIFMWEGAIPEFESYVTSLVSIAVAKPPEKLDYTDFNVVLPELGRMPQTLVTKYKNLFGCNNEDAPGRMVAHLAEVGCPVRVDRYALASAQIRRISEGSTFFWDWVMPETIAECHIMLAQQLGKKPTEIRSATQYCTTIEPLGQSMRGFLQWYMRQSGLQGRGEAFQALRADPVLGFEVAEREMKRQDQIARVFDLIDHREETAQIIEAARKSETYAFYTKDVPDFLRGEQPALERHMKAGDPQARQRVITGFMKRAAEAALDYLGYGLDYDDVVGQILVEVIKAADSTSDVPLGIKMNMAVSRPLDKIKINWERRGSHDAELFYDGDPRLQEAGLETEIARQSRMELFAHFAPVVYEGIEKLPLRYRYVVKAHYGIPDEDLGLTETPMTLEEIANTGFMKAHREDSGEGPLERERIRQLEETAFIKVRKYMRSLGIHVPHVQKKANPPQGTEDAAQDGPDSI
ncbi:RNA polymerase sigma factor RpoH [uncultured archaeon]|nr:RNA polymerase sigma factor RpoH [uncultured archaeon]